MKIDGGSFSVLFVPSMFLVMVKRAGMADLLKKSSYREVTVTSIVSCGRRVDWRMIYATRFKREGNLKPRKEMVSMFIEYQELRMKYLATR